MVVLVLVLPSAGAARAAESPKLAETIAWQVALDRALISPGVIDGRWGAKTTRAIREFQALQGLPATGRPDDATRKALGVDPAGATRTYAISAPDLADVGPWPKTWPEKSRATRLGHKSLAALVAERGHCSLALLARLNPGKNLEALNVGDSLTIPAVSDDPPAGAAARLEVNLADKTIRAVDRSGASLAFVHCSIAKHKSKRPSGSCTVKVVSPDPVYVFDPRMWPEVKGVDRKLVIPPGPRNPVGRFWIGLSLPGYGIHGTPEPELIGKTGSHGCFRLANWDAVRLGALVKPGVPVVFETTPDKPVAIVDAAPEQPAAGQAAPPRSARALRLSAPNP